ncbi:MAG: ABC transporter permease subunit [Candidatus Faecousia sp.]|nr:ABC transporter permease subunit [Clostridiales bacterium]MDY6180572.1 ABC transporter permease subunit [Candidatus Faecousia sp.]
MSKPVAPAVSEPEYNDVLKQQKKRKRAEERKRTLPLYLMMLPGLVYLIANNYLPMFGILIAFKKVNFSVGLLKSEWVGLSNFEYLFKTKDAFVMIRNTVLYNLAWIILGLVIAVFIAICMAEISSRKAAKVIQPVICFPSMVSAVILSFIVYAFLSETYGFLNTTIFKNQPVAWYHTAKYWPIILTIVHFWQNAGQSSIIYMASIGGIDKGLYESARLDGAGKWSQIWNITLPMLKPMIILMMLMSIGRIFNSDFGLFYQVPLGNGLLSSTTQTIDTYVYRALLELNNISMSSAASVFQAVIGFVLVLASNLLVSVVEPDNALF